MSAPATTTSLAALTPPATSMATMLLPVTLLFLTSLPSGVVAPFLPEHPYHDWNPVIEPWWEQLDEADQKAIYAEWEKFEPTAIAWAEMWEAKMEAEYELFRWAKNKADRLKHLVEVSFDL